MGTLKLNKPPRLDLVVGASPSYVKRSEMTRKQTYAALAEWLPGVFNIESPLPLSVGIKKQLAERPDCPKNLHELLFRWVSHHVYLRACVEGRFRYNLDGTTTPILDHERQWAQARLVEYEKIKEPRENLMGDTPCN